MQPSSHMEAHSRFNSWLQSRYVSGEAGCGCFDVLFEEQWPVPDLFQDVFTQQCI